jgi:hypothetical protein
LHDATEGSEELIGGEWLRCSMIDHLSRPFGPNFGVKVRRCPDR